LKQALLTQDVIYVGGGNTKSMLAVWRDWDVPRLLRRAWKNGTVLAGISAGAICWFRMGVTDSWGKGLTDMPCLGLLPGTCCPHYDGEPERRPALHRLVASGAVQGALALDDGAGAHFIERKLSRIVTSRAHARGYEVRRKGSRAVETELPAKLLSSGGRLHGRE
jgi:peptidase E